MFCREHAVQLHREVDRIHAAGAELVLVGSGAPHFVRGFRELTGVETPIYCDPTLASYRAARLKRGAARILHPAAAWKAAKTLAAGFRQGRTKGDATQQGGVLVIRPPGDVVYWHVSAYAGDNAPPAEVVAALEKAAA